MENSLAGRVTGKETHRYKYQSGREEKEKDSLVGRLNGDRQADLNGWNAGSVERKRYEKK